MRLWKEVFEVGTGTKIYRLEPNLGKIGQK
jgi:hypothetical protein